MESCINRAHTWHGKAEKEIRSSCANRNNVLRGGSMFLRGELCNSKIRGAFYELVPIGGTNRDGRSE